MSKIKNNTTINNNEILFWLCFLTKKNESWKKNKVVVNKIGNLLKDINSANKTRANINAVFLFMEKPVSLKLKIEYKTYKKNIYDP